MTIQIFFSESEFFVERPSSPYLLNLRPKMIKNAYPPSHHHDNPDHSDHHQRVRAELETACRLCYSPRVFARDSCTCEERLSPANNLFSYSKHSYL